MGKLSNFRLGRPLTSYAEVQKWAGVVIRNSTRQLRGARVRTAKYLNIGCGQSTNENFINLDYQWSPAVDLCWDLRRGIPLETGSLRGIFMEHCLEHFAPSMARQVIAECRRLLAGDGIIRIVVPDAELYLTRYADRIRGLSDARLPYEGDNSGPPMDVVNRVFYQDRDSAAGHQNMYDFQSLSALLQAEGFSKVTKQSFRSGRDPVLLIDSEYRRPESLYVEAG